MPGRTWTRRRVLALGGVAAAAGVAGVSAAVLQEGSDSSTKSRRDAGGPVRNGPPFQSQELSSEIPAEFERIDGAFEGREFAPGDPVDWYEGMFFLQQDGRVEALRVSEGIASRFPEDVSGPPTNGHGPLEDPDFRKPLAGYRSWAEGEWIHARLWPPYSERALLHHRYTGATFTWDGTKSMVWPVGPYIMLVPIGHLGLGPWDQTNGYVALEYRLYDASLKLVRTGALADTGKAQFDSGDWTVSYDWSTDTLYNFAPGDGESQRFVRVRVRSSDDPEDVPIAPGMESMYERGRGALASTWVGDDRQMLFAATESYSKQWMLRPGGDFAPIEQDGLRSQVSAAISLSGRYLAVQSGLPNLSNPNMERWPTVVILDAATHEPVLRVRSAERGPWSADDQLVLRTVGGSCGLLSLDTGAVTLTDLPGTFPRGYTAQPSPHNENLVALDGAVLFDRSSGIRTTANLPPGTRSYGYWPSEPWSGRPHELAFTLPHWVDPHATEYGEHLLPPVVETPPFDDEVVFVAGVDTELRDGPMDIAAAVAKVAAGQRLRLSINRREEWWGYTTAIWQAGDPQLVWAHVDTDDGAGAWAKLPDLRWAIGTPL